MGLLPVPVTISREVHLTAVNSSQDKGLFFSPKLHIKNFYILALEPHLAVLRSHSFLWGTQAAPVANALTPAQLPVLSGPKDGDGFGSKVMF